MKKSKRKMRKVKKRNKLLGNEKIKVVDQKIDSEKEILNKIERTASNNIGAINDQEVIERSKLDIICQDNIIKKLTVQTQNKIIKKLILQRNILFLLSLFFLLMFILK